MAYRLRPGIRWSAAVCAVLALLALAPVAAHALPDAFGLVPQDAELVVLVPNPAAFSGKVAQLKTSLGLPMAAMDDVLSMFKAETGMILGKSYCDISHRTEGGDNALGILLAVGILYIIFYFFQNLTSTLNDNYKKIKDEKWSKEKFIAILLTLFFVGFFIWAIYQVVMPIIFNLCIYK